MEVRIHRERGEGMVAELTEGRYRVPSFSEPGKTYLVDLDAGYCGCAHHAHTGARCKHQVVARAIGRLRSRRTAAGPAEDVLREMCLKIFAPVGKDYRRSYELFLEVSAYRHSTKAMIRAARRRHKRTLARAEGRAA